MFDRLIESEPRAADFKSRRGYFLLSSVVVGAFFAAAVVVSLYAAEVGLGADHLEMVRLVAPPTTIQTEPEPPRPQVSSPQREATSSALITRATNMRRVDESPREVPPTVSTTQNENASRPLGPFIINGRDSGLPAQGSGRDPGSGPGGGIGPGTLAAASAPVREDPPPVDPPPTRRTEPPRTPPVQTKGIVNGLATSLPKPAYPPAAINMNIQDKVNVQVLIDETGRVISAKAVNGHPLLRSAAESAAKQARFTPTTLSNVPVKVSGVIVYNFSRG